MYDKKKFNKSHHQRKITCKGIFEFAFSASFEYVTEFLGELLSRLLGMIKNHE